MALPGGLESLIKAFSGHGVDEQSIISLLGRSRAEHRQTFRKECKEFFIEDNERHFERWDDHSIKLIKQEFMRFENAVVLWTVASVCVLATMHPWERDARSIWDALREGPESYGVIVEVACTRSSEELLGARKAYHSLFNHSIEEDIATQVEGRERKLLVALVSAYRFEGPKVNEDTAKSEAEILAEAMNAEQKPIENAELIRILSTRSKPQLKTVYKYYKDLYGKNINEDLDHDLILQAAVQCLCTPHKYFSRVLDAALRDNAHTSTKKALARVIVTRADTDIQEINEEYQNQYGVSLAQKIVETASGNYKEFLLTLISR